MPQAGETQTNQNPATKDGANSASVTGLQTEKAKFKKNHSLVAIDAAIESILLPVMTVISDCKNRGGSTQKPQDRFTGGGHICSIADIDSTWPEMFVDNNTRFQYRTVTDSTLSAGTDSEDLVVCNVDVSRCSFL
jgi:hypothetical protein